MQSITFECEVITPMFLAGADGTTPELRPPSIKGALRFWWRALNGHLPIDDVKGKDGKVEKKGLRTIEGEIFGDTSQKSKIIIRVEQKVLKSTPIKPVAHRNFERAAFNQGETFNFVIQVRPNSLFDLDKAEKLFTLTSILGGFGFRSRRGFGCLSITKKNGVIFNSPSTLKEIVELLNQINTDTIRHFEIGFDDMGKPCVQSQFKNAEKYPYIKQIQVGRPQSSLPVKISDTTNRFHRQDATTYDNSMGKAKGERWASPIYVSVLKDDNHLSRSIITTLNPAPPNNQRVNEQLQRSFKNALL